MITPRKNILYSNSNNNKWGELVPSEIWQKICYIHEKYKSNFKGWKLPILIRDLVPFMPVPICEIRMADVDKGHILFESNGVVILIPRSFNILRKRAEAAHELGHILAEKKFTNESDENYIEELSETIGRLLLMPEEIFPDDTELSISPCLSSKIKVIAKYFNTPIPTTGMRLLDIDRIKNILFIRQIIVWDVLTINNEEECILQKRWHSCEGFIPNRSKARLDSITYKAATTGPSYDIEDVSIGSLKGKYYVDACPYAYSSNKSHYTKVLTVFRDIVVKEKINPQANIINTNNSETLF